MSKRMADDDVRRGSASIQTAEYYFATVFQRDSKCIMYTMRSCNLVSPMTLTRCLFWKPKTDKTQSLNTLLPKMNLEPKAVAKTKPKVKSSPISTDMIQKQFEKLAQFTLPALKTSKK